MTRSLAHRGPDGEGLFIAGQHDHSGSGAGCVYREARGGVNVGFGHRRLAIVDTSQAGHQPMHYADRYWITYNGEIFNHLELRDELQRAGYRFRSRTDTEVIMAAFDCWGVGALNRFNGMWAFALLDLRDNKLLLARDRLGVKPLYLHVTGEAFLFASEIKALFRATTKLTPNEAMVRSFLGDNPNDYRPETVFDGVVTLAPGSFILAGVEDYLRNRFAVRRFWELQVNASNERFDAATARDYANRYVELLEDAVRLRLRADVPIGSALSGGLDSPSVVTLVNRQLRKAGVQELQRVFSSTYPTAEHRDIDESDIIHRLIDHLHLDAKEITPTAEMVRNDYARMIYMMDEPPVGTCMSGWFTFKLVAESKVKVTLDGQGADEQLAGYLYYFTYWLTQSKTLLRDAWQAAKLKRARRFVAAGVVFNIARAFAMQSPIRSALRKAGKLHDPFSPLNVRLRSDTLGILGRLLHYSDRISMAHGVESRMPFVDYRMVEFLASVPAAYKLRDGWTKYLARQAMSGQLPDFVVWRRDKLGWPSPDAQWFQGPLRDWAIREVAESRYLRDIGQRHDPAELLTKNPRAFIQLFNVAVWHDVFFEQGITRHSAALREIREGGRADFPRPVLPASAI